MGNQIPVLCIELDTESSDIAVNAEKQRQLFESLHSLAGKYTHTKNLHRFIIHPGFPVDIRHNSKIFREKLRNWAKKNENKITDLSNSKSVGKDQQ